MRRNISEVVGLLVNEPDILRASNAYLDYLQNLGFPPSSRTKPIQSKISLTAVRELADQGYSVSRQMNHE